MSTQPTMEEMWRAVLTGTHPGLRRGRRILRLLPSNPRCKLCNAPFRGIGATITRLMGKRRSTRSPNLCDFCETFASTHRGGAEVEITMFFADVRDSSTLAEQMSASEFGQLMNRFYAAATHVLIDSGAAIDKLIGDEVVSWYVPGFVGPDHARAAVKAAQELLRATGHGAPGGPWLPVGIGIHTGVAFVGVLGGTDNTAADFTALGDNVNIAARLASKAGAGEILVSDAAYRAAGLDPGTVEQRQLELKGKRQTVGVRVLHVMPI